MTQPFILVGAGTEVVTRVLLPACLRLREASGEWPSHVYALAADGDEQTRARHAEARLPAERAPFVPLSMVQVREALAWRRDELEDAWRDEWDSLLVHGPDNGACMVPAVGRMMVKAARPVILQHLRAFARRLAAEGGKAPEIFVVWSPVSGTSRGSVVDLPRYLRAVFPEAAIQAVVLHPVALEGMDHAVARIFQANFIEALRLLHRDAHAGTWRAWIDDASGWETFEGRLIDNVFAFDERYGNLRLRHLDRAGRTLPGRLPALCARVVDFLVGILGGDPSWQRLRARFADAEMHRSDRVVAGSRTHLHAVHETRAWLDVGELKRALVDRALVRIATRLAEAAPPTDAGDAERLFGGVSEIDAADLRSRPRSRTVRPPPGAAPLEDAGAPAAEPEGPPADDAPEDAAPREASAPPEVEEEPR